MIRRTTKVESYPDPCAEVVHIDVVCFVCFSFTIQSQDQIALNL